MQASDKIMQQRDPVIQHKRKGHAPNIAQPVIISEIGLKPVTGC